MSLSPRATTHKTCHRKPGKIKRTLATFAPSELEYLAWDRSTLAIDLVKSYLPRKFVAIVLNLIHRSNAAGLFDGEGCITSTKVQRDCGNGFNFRLRVQIPQNCLETLLAFRERVGESCRLGQLKHRESYTRPIYVLTYDGVHAYRLLKKLRPFLVRKAAEADVVFEYYEKGQPSRHFGPAGVPAAIWEIRQRCYEALRCLK